MKMFLIFAAVIVAALASDHDTVLLKYDSEIIPDGYAFSYATSDGTAREESGQVENIIGGQQALYVAGSVQWNAPNGEKFYLEYVADENGYQPIAAHLPGAPVA